MVYNVIVAPVGATVREIPAEAKVLVVNGQNYHVYAGIYYKTFVSGDEVVYIVSKSPIGTMVESLPDGATVKTINKKTYFLLMVFITNRAKATRKQASRSCKTPIGGPSERL